jgi:hypothetical protein
MSTTPANGTQPATVDPHRYLLALDPSEDMLRTLFDLTRKLHREFAEVALSVRWTHPSSMYLPLVSFVDMDPVHLPFVHQVLSAAAEQVTAWDVTYRGLEVALLTTGGAALSLRVEADWGFLDRALESLGEARGPQCVSYKRLEGARLALAELPGGHDWGERLKDKAELKVGQEFNSELSFYEHYQRGQEARLRRVSSVPLCRR